MAILYLGFFFPFFFIGRYLPCGQMSEPGGSFKLRVGDEGTQRMVEGKVDLGSYVDEEISSSSFEDIPSQVDSAGVIKWLRSVGEARANSFWKRYSFPPNVWVSFPSSRPHFADCTEEDREGMNFMYWSKVHISEGLRYPYHH